MKIKNFLTNLILGLLSCILAISICEWMMRKIEFKGSGGRIPYTDDPILGYLPRQGEFTLKTQEFTAHYHINSFGMNDAEITSIQPKLPILALGDSHTFAFGVSENETWPNLLEKKLFAKDSSQGAVYNAAVMGYSLGQYLLRMRQLIDTLKPKIIIIGFSEATDLYDLIPPRMGGFIYGAGYDRVYFDLDNNKNLVEEKSQKNAKNATRHKSLSSNVRSFMENFALYRKFKRSLWAMWIAAHVHPKNESLWPGLDTALKIQLDMDDSYRWLLAEKIIGQIAREAKDRGSETILVKIPYLAEVYDNLWRMSFGTRPDKYDRFIPSLRLKKICDKENIYFVDTAPRFIREARKGKQLHFPIDAHPNIEGHKIIAEEIFFFIKRLNRKI